ncbi:Molybdenum transport system permease protein ModB [Nocardioides dokdonensis FR1436]|uniref:Molybdenum transport system permease n=1 Tax=Nocardioides dokdonensis FR1436 TaxID=1300347 RepID=A0A1A9GLC9_9ACTN|nr:ABC transporter permease [Nocardioides dokdonensis]ANH38490.1 Molybdenum transport system permease protein ModB [Nocardioides dokdonensis FR1436]
MTSGPLLAATAPGATGAPTTAAPRHLGRPPLVLLVPAVLAAVLLVLPLATLVLDTPWGSFWSELRSEPVRRALGLSALTSLLTVAACVVLGTPLAWLLARVEFPGRSLLRAAVTVPLVLPPVVAGVALVTALGRNGVVGSLLRETTGISIPFTTSAVVIAHTFVSMPFFVLSVEGALRTAGERYDVVAATLGADRWTTFRRVTLPLAMPGLVAGAALAWARSLGEFGATITFAGNFPGTTQTMPSLIYTTLQADPAAARTLSMILLIVSVGVLAGLRHRWLRPR